ncbi:hypothetical protein KIW84_030043 [Lathyrus oleraceus]|uniref:Reverse transcriptase/retrotransposon-derived protein RNase H-like domain-containing protein n=1 Tax=Pisum sativum TaxID=3888 RepID=A0A9D5AYE1_PEA|nr:hypothetical protein KIW84_030043 [Pisum sativum]
MSKNVVCGVLIKEQDFHPSSIYFISRVLARPETHYQKIEKATLAFVTASRKLHRYLSIKRFTASKMENSKKERKREKREENEAFKEIMDYQSKWTCGAHYPRSMAPATLVQEVGGARHQPLRSGCYKGDARHSLRS